MEKILKIGLVILIFGCLLDMPYGYFQFVRFIALIGFGILAYKAYKQEKEIEVIVFGALSLLFQPLFKISLDREIWNIVDIIVGIGLLLSLLKSKIDK